MPTVVVDVYDNQVLIERCERVLRRLPDGAPGVSFRGVVYPLRDHSRVDLQDAWAYEMHCPVARSLPTGWPTGRPHSSGVSWCLESGGYAPYLFLNCTQAKAEAIRGAIEAHDIPVRKLGQSLREAEDGLFYHWFLRLDEAHAGAVDATLIGSIIEQTPPAPDARECEDTDRPEFQGSLETRQEASVSSGASQAAVSPVRMSDR